jgi:predicted transcriptional regulator YdeE
MFHRFPSPAVLCLGIALFIPKQVPESRMQPHHQDSFYVAGYSVRTNNAREMSGHGEIGALWQKFMQQNAASVIPDRVGNDILAVYSDYASDEKGDYTYTLGVRVSRVDSLPAGMTWRKIAAGPYDTLTTDSGVVTKVVPAAWLKIWAMNSKQLGGKRSFGTDYEVYGKRSADPQHAQVDIHIGIKHQD